MKKTLSAIILMVMLFPVIRAQNYLDDPRNAFGMGVRAGINSSNLYDTKGEGFTNDTRIGFVVGGFLSVPIGTYLGFQPEILYSQKGFKGYGTMGSTNYSYTRNLDYIDIPLQLQLKPSTYITLLAGPQYSFLVNQGFTMKSGNLTVTQEQQVRDQNIRKNILGITLGFDIHVENLILSGRVAWDMQNNNGDGTTSSPRYKNVILQATAGIAF
jgi:hypothetical protein